MHEVVQVICPTPSLANCRFLKNSSYCHVKPTRYPILLCCGLPDIRVLHLVGVGDMSWFAGIQSRGKVESRELPSGRDLYPCHSSSYSFRWEVPGPSLLTPCPNPGPRPALGTLGSDPFFSYGQCQPARWGCQLQCAR